MQDARSPVDPPINKQLAADNARLSGLRRRNIITILPMHEPVSPGTALLAMSAPARIAMALGVSGLLWLCAWWALS